MFLHHTEGELPSISSEKKLGSSQLKYTKLTSILGFDMKRYKVVIPQTLSDSEKKAKYKPRKKPG